MSLTLDLLKELIRCPSITPNDAGCQRIIANRLQRLKFKIEPMRFGDVDNLWARFGDKSPLFVFAGHTDVVPEGPKVSWQSPPFEPTERDGLLYGRGAADMKSGLAASIIAAENFLKAHPNFKGSIAFLITSDEEGVNINGTKKVVEVLEKRKEKIDYCIVGEASSEKQLGDQIRIGRRGSLHAHLTVFGKQGHVAYPDLASNPIHHVLAALDQIVQESWDEGSTDFPPTTMQISNIAAGTGAKNIIPGKLDVWFNFRFSDASSPDVLQQKVIGILKRFPLNFALDWDLSGVPFITKQGPLLRAATSSIKTMLGLDPLLSTGGGTSDARFIAPTGAEVIELGPCNTTVHQANENVAIKDIETLTHLYQNILEKVLIPKE